MEWIWMVLDAGLSLLAQPFYYISVVIIALLYRRQVLLERKLFHVRVNGWETQTLRTIAGGIIAGIGVSIVMAFLGITLTLGAVLCIWAATLLLMLFRVRFLCFAYAISLLGVLQFMLGWFPKFQPAGWGGSIQSAILELNIPALLALAAVLHFAEAILVLRQGSRFATPLFLEGKRGKLVGGYQMQSFWPLPLFLLIPASGGPLLPWTPFFGGEAWLGGVSIAALPVLIGFGEMTQSMLPRDKASVSAKRLVLYSAVVLALSMLAAWWAPLVIVAALTALVLHEGLVWFSRYEEQQRSPIFVHPPKGLRVLAVLPGSPADELGILAGETILKVNGTLVYNKEQLHAALRQNAAFCKLEVQNHQGESKFMQRAIYSGEHHQLGAIIAPDPDAGLAVRLKPISVFGLLGMKLNLKSKSRVRDSSGTESTEHSGGIPDGLAPDDRNLHL
ncbi:PDZ domain-containing protein [Paenibacillus lemnae]|uniref:PDZ domain-containing protein n=1 Tax=Paenibacillus lemnae TaxID=1330551 RepID=A0A848M7N9_PAELE|nr:PDZ domain-containing protein [Paenibacillus lemnae]NMO96675.1 PDZ domain-containing protein [Paenibacillus lemnae]